MVVAPTYFEHSPSVIPYSAVIGYNLVNGNQKESFSSLLFFFSNGMI
jgi:hypothetical protein